MKVLVEVASKNIDSYVGCCDGILLGLSSYSVLNAVGFTVEEISSIAKEYPTLEIFVKMDKNFMNDEVDSLKDVLVELDQLPIEGVFFYDMAVLEIKQELSLALPLVWSQTHMVSNYRTCNYFLEQGVNYALLSKEITLDEIEDISEKSDISTIVEVVSHPSVGYSRRKLVSNYYQDLEEEGNSTLSILERITNQKYIVKEEDAGTGFLLDQVMNGTSVIASLYRMNIDYVLLREEGISDFLELLLDTKTYVDCGCKDTNYVEKYKKLGDNTGFFFKKTIYRVKK